MNDFLQIVGHVRRFNSATKDLSIDALKEIRAKLEKIIEDRIASEENDKLKNAEKLEKMEQYRKMLADDGIDPAELIEEYTAKKGKRPSRPAKYGIIDASGERVTWTGQGRMPNVFKAEIDAGKSIDEFLIK